MACACQLLAVGCRAHAQPATPAAVAAIAAAQLVRQEQVDAVREELGGKAASDADAALEAERACVGDATRAELEAQLAAAAAAAEAAAAEAEVRARVQPCSGRLTIACMRLCKRCWRPFSISALNCAQSNGEEPSPYQEPDLDVEGRVAAAMAAVAAQPAAPVTDADVLSALMEQGVLTKDAIVNALAVSMLGGGGGGEGGI